MLVAAAHKPWTQQAAVAGRWCANRTGKGNLKRGLLFCVALVGMGMGAPVGVSMQNLKAMPESPAYVWHDTGCGNVPRLNALGNGC